MVSCSDVRSERNVHTYMCDLYTAWGCPGHKSEPTELSCNICEVFINLVDNYLMKDEKKYVDTIEQFYCPQLKDPKPCYDMAQAEVSDIVEQLKEKLTSEEICKDLKYCK